MPFPRRTLLALLLLTACSQPRGQGRELVVLAAASTTDVVQELASRFPDTRVRTGFGASSALARQIEDGAPAGVFLSANERWARHLEQGGHLLDPPLPFAANGLVCIAPPDSPLSADPPAGAGELVEALAGRGRLALADPGVPAGDYARESLAATGHLAALEPRIVGLGDVRAVLAAVSLGQADAGFVYSTDARAADVAVLFTVDPSTHRPITYWAAVPASAPDPDLGRRFVAFLRSPEAREVLEAAGFRTAEQ